MAARRWLLVIGSAFLVAAGLRTFASDGAAGLSDEDRKQLESGVKELTDRLAVLRAGNAVEPDHLADAEVFAKGISWAVRYDVQFDPADVGLLKKALDRGKERVGSLESGQGPWAARRAVSSVASSPPWTARCSPMA